MTPNDRAALGPAMKITLIIAILLLIVKLFATYISGSAAILSDAAASVVHLAAIAFAAYGLYYSRKNPDTAHLYGFSKINFFSAGFEGAMVIMAGIITIIIAANKWSHGTAITSIEYSTLLMAGSAILTALLGAYLINYGKSRQSLVVESNGHRIMHDAFTSIAVVVGLLLYSFSGWRWIDPVCAILVAIYVLGTGIDLMRRSFDGLADKADPTITRQLTEILSQRCAQYGIHFHQLHHRNTGDRHMVDVHLLFPAHTEVGEAHRIASEIEVTLISSLSNRAHILTHLEAMNNRDNSGK